MESVKGFFVFAMALLVAGCTGGNGRSDGYGQFEATEINVSAEASGKVMKLDVDEGMKLQEGQVVGQIDTTQLGLQLKELHSKIEAARAKIPTLNTERSVLEVQLQLAQQNLKRINAMRRDSAATAQQVDDAVTRAQVLKRRIESVDTQKRQVQAEISTIRANIAKVRDQVENATITNPGKGTVLEQYVEPGEVVNFGTPIYKMADLSTMKLRVYVDGAQLPHIKLGQQVQVLIDEDADSYRELKGTISWIADQAEFTPTQIQTKEERVTQVYAVDVEVPNDGSLKIGMPGEVNFDSADGGTAEARR